MSFKKVAAGCVLAAQCLIATLAMSPAQAATATSAARDNGVIHIGDLRDNGVIHIGDLRDNGVIHIGD
jgi:hypothetical protein